MDASTETDKPVVQSNDIKQRLASLYAYLAKKLQLRETPKVKFTNDEKNAENPFGMTGYYEPKTKAIVLYITDRHDTDILRSFAHEVIHHWQNENGTLTSNEANGHYAQENENLRKREMEAYLFGNILFRDWQDENRYGPPKKQPLMPQPINENNFKVENSTRLKKGFEKLLQLFIKDGTISTFDRDLTSGTMQPADFVNDFANVLVSALDKQIETINGRSNRENPGDMIQENDPKMEAWIRNMAEFVRDILIDENQLSIDEYGAYDLLKVNFRPDAPSSEAFDEASKRAIALLKQDGTVK